VRYNPFRYMRCVFGGVSPRKFPEQLRNRMCQDKCLTMLLDSEFA